MPVDDQNSPSVEKSLEMIHTFTSTSVGEYDGDSDSDGARDSVGARLGGSEEVRLGTADGDSEGITEGLRLVVGAGVVVVGQ